MHLANYNYPVFIISQLLTRRLASAIARSSPKGMDDDLSDGGADHVDDGKAEENLVVVLFPRYSMMM